MTTTETTEPTGTQPVGSLFTPGSLVEARGRDWVVLPETTESLVMVKPLGGTDHEVTGILPELEPIKPSNFGLPDPERLGDFRSARMLRDALRLGFRSSSGPFRSFAKIAVEPRPYQLVPLLMALKHDPVVRILIADDVGIGKTVESALIAKELLETGRARKLAVLCPPHLAEQWQAELKSKFHIDAELVLASTAARLERNLAAGESLFEVYDNFVVSIDFIKSDRRRADFIRACPDLVIVDEAHICAEADSASGSRHQRHELLRALSGDESRHMILVTATPHSGKQGSFRSLLSLLKPEFSDLPDTLAGDENRSKRNELARHLVQRRRADIRKYLHEETKFPERLEAEKTYSLSAQYRTVFDQVFEFARRTVNDASGKRERRVHWWTSLGILRALASSPAAAAATMRTRAVTDEARTAEEADEIGRDIVLDQDEFDDAVDVVPGAQIGEVSEGDAVALRRFADQVDELRGEHDAKLQGLIDLLKKDLLKSGHSPIVFCRFIETAEYVAEELSKVRAFSKVAVRSVTGRIPPSDRESRVAELATHEKRILVATDCLSEGINLQDQFSAVVHYDLPWNPTRLEQREGRVDRFGQEAPEVRVLTYFGDDNIIDRTVLDVLVNKHRAIRKDLGISIPVPGNTGEVIEALAETLLAASEASISASLPGVLEHVDSKKEELHTEWQRQSDKEKASQSLFAQNPINPDEVQSELDALRSAIGSGADVEKFFTQAVQAYKGTVTVDALREAVKHVNVEESPRTMRDALAVSGDRSEFSAAFDLPVPLGTEYLSRTHSSVSGLAAFVLESALDEHNAGHDSHAVGAARCAVTRTSDVETRATLLVCRYRFNLSSKGSSDMLAEEAALHAFTGSPTDPTWLSEVEAESLLAARPSGNVDTEPAKRWLREVIDASDEWQAHLRVQALAKARVLEEAHEKVRQADRRGGRASGATRSIEAVNQPVDVLGMFIYLPKAI